MSDTNPNQVQVPTLLVSVLDKSGSMAEKREDVVGGYNGFLKDQQALPDPCRMLRVLFNTEVEVIDMGGPVPIAEAKPLDLAAKSGEQAYLPGGLTALYDAVMAGIGMADKHVRPGERVLVLIITDGLENSSRETTMQQVRAALAAKEATGTWTFAYVGERPDKWAHDVGMHAGATSAYQDQAPAESFREVSRSTTAYRCASRMSVRDFFKDKDKVN